MGSHLAWGCQSPAEASPIAWTEFEDGADGAITVIGNASWGSAEVALGEEIFSAVKDEGRPKPVRVFLHSNQCASGTGNHQLFFRWSDTLFARNDTFPAWELYSAPVLRTIRYWQVMAKGGQGV